jgi:HTH-like domain
MPSRWCAVANNHRGGLRFGRLQMVRWNAGCGRRRRVAAQRTRDTHFIHARVARIAPHAAGTGVCESTARHKKSFGHLSRSAKAVCRASGKQNGQRWKEDAELRAMIAQSFEQSRNTYGSPPVRIDLCELGQRCSKNRAPRLMRESGPCVRQKRRFRPRTTDSRHNHKIAENRLAKVPAPDYPASLAKRHHLHRDPEELALSGLYPRCLFTPLHRLPGRHAR